MYSPGEIVENYVLAGKKKVERPLSQMIVLAILAGLIISLGGVSTNSLVATIDNYSTVRLITGLIFPFCLAIIMLVGAELFTGNCLISMTVLSKKTSLKLMFRNLLVVYGGNCVASIIVAAAMAFSGQMNYGGGKVAVYTIKLAAYKCGLAFPSAVVLGIFCNLLVCLAVICSLSAKDTWGKISGSYLAVAFFIFCGFEHCVANMYYIPAGLFALTNPQYVTYATQAGIDFSNLTWGSFLLNNLLPVSLGNLIGGLIIGCLFWFCFPPAINNK